MPLPDQQTDTGSDPALDRGDPAARDPVDAFPATVLLKSLLVRVVRAAKSGCTFLLEAAKTAGAKLQRAWMRLRAAVHVWPRASVRLPAVGIRQIAILLIALVVALPAAFLIFCFATLPSAPSSAEPPNTGAFVLRTAEGQTLATRGVYKGDEITADRIPQPLGKAVIAIEDRRFYAHGGLDFYGIVRALWNDVSGGDLQGASTITQQLARLRYLSPDRTLRRKVQEAMLAERLEWRLGKREILARYLNSAYFGYGAYGADSAALRYFSKHASDLSLSEAAMLAGLIRAPSALAPDKNLEGARQRANLVLGAMAETGAITPQQAKAAREHPAQLRVAAEAPAGSNYFIDTAVREAKAISQRPGGDLTLETTFEPAMQRLAQSVVAKYLGANETSKNVHQAALVAMGRDGAILAMVGGRDYRSSQFNRVTQAKRQPGSLFKLFVYLAALRKGFTPNDVMTDRPISIGDWEPENYADRYYGRVTLRKAFAHSLNSVAVQLAEEVGIDDVIRTAKRAGITSDLPNAPSLALGSASVTLLEMTSAFAAVSSNVDKIEPFTVRKVESGDSAVYKRQTQRFARADNIQVHQAMLDLLEAPVRDGTATAARLNVPVGGKTGTSQDYRDAWFIGFTPDLVVGVWVGNDDNSSTNGVTGGSIPAAIWHDFVSGVQRLSPHIETVSLAPTDTGAASAVLSGKLKILRDGTVKLAGQTIQLAGVDNADRHLPRRIRSLLRRRPVICTPSQEPDAYNCTLGDLDLNAAILLSRGEAPNLADASEAADEYIHPRPRPRHHRYRHHFLFFQW